MTEEAMDNRVLELAREQTEHLGRQWDSKLEPILLYCLQSPGYRAFPGTFPAQADDKAIEAFLMRYLKRYFEAREIKLMLKDVSTVPDPAVDVILTAFSDAKNLHEISEHHRKAMAAENLLGELLERYLASMLEPHGWVWCVGSSVKAIDFLKADLSVALQIKNRDNSENSSSSSIRVGTDIQKWFRVFSKTGKTNWDRFPQQLAEPLTEEGFYAFIRTYAQSR